MDNLTERFARVKLVLMDVDGVLTDGRIVLGNYGDELKFFDVQDGLGMVLLRRAGLKTVIVSAKKSRINQTRAKEVAAVKIYQNVRDKLKIYERLLRKFKLKPEEVCFIGDDLVDLPVLKRAGLAVAVPDAAEEAKAAAHYVTQRRGGRGAVREVADRILKSQGKWEKAAGNFLK